MQDSDIITPVLIVGGGPFGLMCSIELARRGVRSFLIDAKPGTALSPQANATQARTMEHYRRLGFSDEIRALGLPRDYPTDIAYFTRFAHRELARIELPSSGSAAAMIRTLSSSWSAAELPHRVSQKFVEQVLRRHASASPLASINYGWRLEDFDADEHGARATIADVATGETRTVQAAYLIAGDGARSSIRKALGIGLTGETGVSRDFFGGKMVAVYLRAPDFYAAIPHRRAWMYWSFNPERRAWLAAVNGKDEFAMHTQLKPGEDDAVTPERARELFAQVSGSDMAIEILGVDTWTAGHALVAERLREGRVFIGGDAAHLFTPAGGLGYNTAVEDAVNLGWKLAATLKGIAGPALLDSYAHERGMLAERNTGYARLLASSIGNFVPDPAIERDDPAGDTARKHAGAFLAEHGRREFDIPGITFGGRYDGSAVIATDEGVAPPDAINAYVPTTVPGGRLPHLWLSDGRSLFDLLGFEWTLLAIDATAAEIAAFRRAAAVREMELKVVELPPAETGSLFDTQLVLVRPDQIVAWRRRARAGDPDAVLDLVLGGPAPIEARRIAAGAA